MQKTCSFLNSQISKFCAFKWTKSFQEFYLIANSSHLLVRSPNFGLQEILNRYKQNESRTFLVIGEKKLFLRDWTFSSFIFWLISCNLTLKDDLNGVQNLWYGLNQIEVFLIFHFKMENQKVIFLTTWVVEWNFGLNNTTSSVHHSNRLWEGNNRISSKNKS